jgi:hypothetical protein
MINKEYIDKITKHYNDLHDEYKKLEDIVKLNPALLLQLDNEHNIYAYSDKVKLFEALEMIIKGNSAYSDIDLINRVIHYIAIQYSLFSYIGSIDNKGLSYNPTITGKVKDINSMLLNIVSTMISTVSLDELPKYISAWVTKYADLQQVAAELKRNKIIANGVML